MKDVEGILLTDQQTDIGNCTVVFATDNLIVITQMTEKNILA